MRFVYMRVTVNGISRDKTTKRKWDADRWNPHTGRPTGTKEDAKSLTAFLDALQIKIHDARTELIQRGVDTTAGRILDIVSGKKIFAKTKVLEEFEIHNNEMHALIRKEKDGEGFAEGTHERYVTARSHVRQFINDILGKEDLNFTELNFQFINDYYFWLVTARNCNNNTALKYISNFKKIVRIAVDKGIILESPFKRFKKKKTKLRKRPLSSHHLKLIEELVLTLPRLELVRDIFIFQCHTGLAYADVYKLKKTDIVYGIDNEQWIRQNRQKTKSETDVPLLPTALRIIEKYKDDPRCLKTGKVLPVFANQNMNAYLKEIAALAGIDEELTTHKARRTFASTIALKNGVPIHVVRDMLGHESVTQTEDYAITSQETISKEMRILKNKLIKQKEPTKEDLMKQIKTLQAEITAPVSRTMRQIRVRIVFILPQLHKGADGNMCPKTGAYLIINFDPSLDISADCLLYQSPALSVK